jgi:hypothetical protein
LPVIATSEVKGVMPQANPHPDHHGPEDDHDEEESSGKLAPAGGH